MMYPRVSDAMKEYIQAGEFVSELKAAYGDGEFPAMRPEEQVYVCPTCGFWDLCRAKPSRRQSWPTGCAFEPSM